ncbi:MAG: outer membrane beta-barrel protein [Candidatus Omnitrophica bacterium]|nr:outer membrane beta-barrel protein [Candidatus Omnitrophota bacterium]
MLFNRAIKLQISVVSILSFFSLLFPQPGFSWENAFMKIEPQFKVDSKWDNNIFYDSNNKKSDLENIFSPGLFTEIRFGSEAKHKVQLQYLTDLGVFGRYPEQNYGNHDFTAGVGLDFEKYTFDIGNKYQFTSSRAGSEFTSRVLRKIDTLDAVFGAHYNKIDFDLGYRFYMVDFLSNLYDEFNRKEDSVSLTGYVQVAPKTKALAEVTLKDIVYTKVAARDAQAIRFMTGFKGELTGKLTGIVKGGYKYQKYDSEETKPFSNFCSAVEVLYAMSDRVDIGLSYTREPFESTYSVNNYYTGDHILANVRYLLGKSFVLTLDGMYFHNAYNRIAAGDLKKRVDNEWSADIVLDYLIKEWISVGTGYTYHTRLSNIDRMEYSQNVIDLHGKLSY